MSEKKTIQLNPKFLLGKNSSKTEKKRKNRSELTSMIKPNNIKASLINKIKSHQNKAKKDKSKNKDNITNFTKDFNENLNYLENVIKSRKEKKKEKREKKRQRSLKKHLSNPNNTNVNNTNGNNIITGGNKNDIQVQIPTDINAMKPELVEKNITETSLSPSVKINEAPVKESTFKHNFTQKEPPYGCLKGGSKPTYSQYQRTIKSTSNKIDIPKLNIETTDDDPTSIENPSILERQSKLSKLKDVLATPKMGGKKDKFSVMRKFKKTIKIYKLGKIKNKVGVLVKSGLTRKKVKDEQKVLKETCLNDVKKYLRKHNFIKSGSSAPEDVLRTMYEESYLSGKIFNKNPENLLHNYLNDDEHFN